MPDTPLDHNPSYRRVLIRRYCEAHGREPRGAGLWVFVNVDDGQEHQYTGPFSEAIQTIPYNGRWSVLP